MARHHIVPVAPDFWNIRGSFRTLGVLDLGTHCSLVRRADGSFVMLDSYTLSGDVLAEVRALTDGGRTLAASLNLHPFHTLHVRAFHEQFPTAKLYGTGRHLEREPALPWQPLRTEAPELHEAFAADLEFSVPQGVLFVHPNAGVHFSSVLAYHRSSRTVHVDDTFGYLKLPGFAQAMGARDLFGFHPTLSRALQRRAGAAADFRRWAESLAERWSDARTVCFAHDGVLTLHPADGFAARLRRALDAVGATLDAHERRFG